MLFKDYVGYQEGKDISKIPTNFLAFPSKNVIIYKGVGYSRPGIKNDGNAPTSNNKIVGEFVWKDALAGELPMRATADGRLQFKWVGLWITVFSGLTNGALHVRFATWIDSNGLIIKNRLFIVDGSTKIWEWNGAVGTIASVDGAAKTITLAGTKTLQQLAFDPGNAAKTGTITSTGAVVVGVGTKFATELAVGQSIVASGQTRVIATITDDTHLTVSVAFSPDVAGVAFTLQQNVKVVRFSAGAVAGIESYVASDDASTGVMQLTGSFSMTPVAGDIVVGGVIEHTLILAGIIKDDLYTYKNRLTIGTLTGLRVYFSSVTVKLDYTVPAAISRTAVSPFFVDLPSNYTAMLQRFNQSTQATTLWVSDLNGWTKVNALIDQDNFGNWVATQRHDESERLGALPFAVADFKGDGVYVAQDLTLQRITTIDILSKDSILLLSDEIEGMLQRLGKDTAGVRVYYLTRYIYVVFPKASTLVMLDTIETHGEANPLFGCQPPQTLPLSCMSTIDGVLTGHSNVRDESFAMFTGRNDLGAKIVSVFAFPNYQGFQFRKGKTLPQDFALKSATKIGISSRMTKTTIVDVATNMEEGGLKGTFPFTIDGSKVKRYEVPDDETWASHIWGSSSIGGADDPANPLGRVYAWSTFPAVAWYEFAPILTVSGAEQEFHLLGWYIDDAVDPTKVPADLFIDRDA